MRSFKPWELARVELTDREIQDLYRTGYCRAVEVALSALNEIPYPTGTTPEEMAQEMWEYAGVTVLKKELDGKITTILRQSLLGE